MKLMVFIFIYVSVYSQVCYKEDITIINEKLNKFSEIKYSDYSVEQLVVEIGKSFLGTNYQPGTLDLGNEEELIINADSLDCYTFLELTSALVRTVKSDDCSVNKLSKEVANLRYINGEKGDYTSRLHYFSDWIFENEKRGNIKNVTKDLNGIKYLNDVFFMSKNSDKYPHLKNNIDFVNKIAVREKEIALRDYYYIPKEDIEKIESLIQSGYLLAFTTGINGLDISHVGIAVNKDGRIHLLHAPASGLKIQISEEPLSEYALALKRHTGIMVFKLLTN